MTQTTDEMEQPAKQWQMAAIQAELKVISGQITQLLDTATNYATHKDVQEATERQQAYTDEKYNVLEAKIGPIVKLFWTLVTALVITTATVVVQISMQIRH